ncbi:MAG: PH domain-containing protein [Anaeromyxobacteraceae bacterium]
MLKATIALSVLFLIVVGGRYLWSRGSTPGRLHVPASGGMLVLRPPRLQGILLGFGALLPAVVFGALGVRAWLSGATGMGGRIAVVVATVLTLGLSVHQFLSAFRQRIVVHLTGFQRVGVATRREMRWDDVVSVAYNPFHRWFFLTSSTGAHVWISEELAGIGDFAAVALRRLPHRALDGDPDAREELEDLAASARTGASP